MQAYGRVAMACVSLWLAGTLVQAQVPQVIRPTTRRSSTAPKKEGKVVVYSTTDAKLVTPLIKDFEAAFPGVKVEYTRPELDRGLQPLHQRERRQRGIGRRRVELVDGPADEARRRRARGASTSRRRAAALPEWAHWKDTVYATTFEPIAIVYNKRLVPPDEVPKTHADFAKLLTTKADKYQKQGHDVRRREVGRRLHARQPGREARPAVLGPGRRSMGARSVNMQSSTGTMMERIASGENLIGYNVLGSLRADAREEGSVDRRRVHDRLQPRAVAARCSSPRTRRIRMPAGCGSTTCCRSAARRSRRSRRSSIRCAPT